MKFGLMLDGTKDSERRLKSMYFWDVNNGISRRNWKEIKKTLLLKYGIW